MCSAASGGSTPARLGERGVDAVQPGVHPGVGVTAQPRSKADREACGYGFRRRGTAVEAGYCAVRNSRPTSFEAVNRDWIGRRSTFNGRGITTSTARRLKTLTAAVEACRRAPAGPQLSNGNPIGDNTTTTRK